MNGAAMARKAQAGAWLGSRFAGAAPSRSSPSPRPAARPPAQVWRPAPRRTATLLVVVVAAPAVSGCAVAAVGGAAALLSTAGSAAVVGATAVGGAVVAGGAAAIGAVGAAAGAAGTAASVAGTAVSVAGTAASVAGTAGSVAATGVGVGASALETAGSVASSAMTAGTAPTSAVYSGAASPYATGSGSGVSSAASGAGAGVNPATGAQQASLSDFGPARSGLNGPSTGSAPSTQAMTQGERLATEAGRNGLGSLLNPMDLQRAATNCLSSMFNYENALSQFSVDGFDLTEQSGDGAEAKRPGLSVVVNPSIGLCLVLADSASLQVAMSAVEKALDRQFGGAAKIKLVEARLGKSCGGFEVDSSSGPISITFGQGSATYACGMEGGQVMTMRRGPA